MTHFSDNIKGHQNHHVLLYGFHLLMVGYSYLKKGGVCIGKDLRKIGEVAQLSGVSVRTIDYYTTSGLLNFERSAANYRLYHNSVLQTLERIQLLKSQRMSIAEIKEALGSNSQSDTDVLVEDVFEEFNCLQKKSSV